MKKKNGVLWWFRRKKRPVIAINTKEVNTQATKNQVYTKEDKEIIEKEDTIPFPILEVDKPKQKENERYIQPKKNERDTLIKPNKSLGLENTIEIKKEKIKIEEPKEKTKTKAFVEEESLTNEINIKTDTLDEIEKMILVNYSEIQNIRHELEVLEEKEQDEVIHEEVEKLIDELNKLIKKFEEIKKSFYQKNFEELYNHSTNDSYIGFLIEEYKTSFKNDNTNQTTILQIKQIEEYIALINDIINIETKKDDLEKKLNDKKETFEIRDDDFEDLKDRMIDTNKINNYIETFSSEYNHIIKNIQEKVERSTTITKTAEYKTEIYIDYTKLLTSTLLLATTPIIPFTRKGNLLRTGLILMATTGMASAIKTRSFESKTITKIDFIDYEKQILSSINSVQDISLMIDKTMLDIKDMKNEFQKEFSEYANQIPDYYKLLVDLDTIEKNLLAKQIIIREYDKKLEKTLEQNNVKVKRLEEEIHN